MVTRVVPGSPAATAGLHAATRRVTVDGATALVGGDAIVGANGEPVDSDAALAGAMALKRPGDTMQLTVVNGGRTRTVDIRLGTVRANAGGVG
jgi:S1-C subfamily serine protease